MHSSLYILRCGVILVCLLCQGCVTSTYVSAIGARTQTGSVDVEEDGNPYKIIITDYKRVPSGIENSGVTIPYISLVPKAPGVVVGEAWIKPADVDWVKTSEWYKEGEVSVHFSGETENYCARAYPLKEKSNTGYRIEVEHNYRRWYGYPAQLLLLGSIPIDAVIIAGTAVYVFVGKIFF